MNFERQRLGNANSGLLNNASSQEYGQRANGGLVSSGIYTGGNGKNQVSGIFNQIEDHRSLGASPHFGQQNNPHNQYQRQHKSSHLNNQGGEFKIGHAENQHSKIMASNRQYLSHSPQPYTKSKLTPNSKNLMVYGQNGAKLPYGGLGGSSAAYRQVAGASQLLREDEKMAGIPKRKHDILLVNKSTERQPAGMRSQNAFEVGGLPKVKQNISIIGENSQNRETRELPRNQDILFGLPNLQNVKDSALPDLNALKKQPGSTVQLQNSNYLHSPDRRRKNNKESDDFPLDNYGLNGHGDIHMENMRKLKNNETAHKHDRTPQPNHRKREDPASPSSVQYAQISHKEEQKPHKNKLFSGTRRNKQDEPESQQAYGAMKSHSPAPNTLATGQTYMGSDRAKLQYNQMTNFTGINIRRNQSQNPGGKINSQMVHREYTPEKQNNDKNTNVIEVIATKTRQGFIPQMRKTNQDSFMVIKDFGGMQDLHMLGVMDGHGVFGHTVSQFVKLNLPIILNGLIRGSTKQEMSLQSGRIQIKEKPGKGGKQGFLPPLSGNRSGFGPNTDDEVTKDGDKWISTEKEKRDLNVSDAFDFTQDFLDSQASRIDANFSGTTCVICFLSNNHLICANAGDSRAILCSIVNGKWVAKALSRDHKPEEADEAQRVKRTNGRIECSRLQPGMVVPGMKTTPGMFYGPKRVWLKHKQVPGLAMTRSIGDMAATSVGVIARPEITCFPNLTSNDKVLVIASDGLFDRLTNYEIMSIIATQYYKNRDADGAANHLMKESVDRWQREQGMVDDITIIVAYLNVQDKATEKHA